MTAITSLPTFASPEVFRLSPTDARYIVTDGSKVISAGLRSEVSLAVRFCGESLSDDFDLDALFETVDTFGGNTVRTAYGVGRHVTHNDAGKTKVIVTMFDGVVGGVVPNRSARQVADALSYHYTLMPEYNNANSRFLTDGMIRNGVASEDARNVLTHIIKPSFQLGVLNRDVEWSLADIAFAITKPSVGKPVGKGRNVEASWWAAAASFLLADLFVGKTYDREREVVEDALEALGDIATLDAFDIMRVVEWFRGDSDALRSLIGRSAAGEMYDLDTLHTILSRGRSVADAVEMFGAGIDADLVRETF